MQKYPYSFFPVEMIQEHIMLDRQPVEDLLAALPPPSEAEPEVPKPESSVTTSTPTTNPSTTNLTSSSTGNTTNPTSQPTNTTNPTPTPQSGVRDTVSRDSVSNSRETISVVPSTNKFNVDLSDIGVTKAPPGQLKSFLTGLILRDDEFKAELSILIRDTMAEELDMLREEISQISSSFTFNVRQGREGQVTINNPNALRVLEQEFPGESVQGWNIFDESGAVHGTPGNVSVDIVRHGGVTHLCQHIPAATKDELTRVMNIGKLFKSQNPGEALSCLIITSNIDEQTTESATKCKIRVLVI